MIMPRRVTVCHDLYYAGIFSADRRDDLTRTPRLVVPTSNLVHQASVKMMHSMTSTQCHTARFDLTVISATLQPIYDRFRLRLRFPCRAMPRAHPRARSQQAKFATTRPARRASSRYRRCDDHLRRDRRCGPACPTRARSILTTRRAVRRVVVPARWKVSQPAYKRATHLVPGQITTVGCPRPMIQNLGPARSKFVCASHVDLCGVKRRNKTRHRYWAGHGRLNP
jgi:hypothetical protein